MMLRVRCGAGRGGHHPQPVPGRVLDQDGHDVPGRVRVEMPVRVPHHPRHQSGVQVRELTRETLRYMVNRGAFGIGGHHPQRAGPRRARSITQTDAPPRRVDGIRPRSDTRAESEVQRPIPGGLFLELRRPVIRCQVAVFDPVARLSTGCSPRSAVTGGDDPLEHRIGMNLRSRLGSAHCRRARDRHVMSPERAVDTPYRAIATRPPHRGTLCVTPSCGAGETK
jgi:hypothetical protein